MLKVLGRANSINVRKVLWTLHEIGADYALEEWGSEHLPLCEPAFLALNPNAMVPVLLDDGFVLRESNTIARYLATSRGRPDLLGRSAREVAITEQWMDWQATELNNAWRYAFMALVRRSARHDDPQAIAASVASWNHHMRILDAQLASTGAFVTGPSFTLADVVLGLSLNRWLMTPIERPELAALASYYDRLSERPGFGQHGRNGLP